MHDLRSVCVYSTSVPLFKDCIRRLPVCELVSERFVFLEIQYVQIKSRTPWYELKMFRDFSCTILCWTRSPPISTSSVTHLWFTSILKTVVCNNETKMVWIGSKKSQKKLFITPDAYMIATPHIFFDIKRNRTCTQKFTSYINIHKFVLGTRHKFHIQFHFFLYSKWMGGGIGLQLVLSKLTTGNNSHNFPQYLNMNDIYSDKTTGNLFANFPKNLI